MTDSTYPLIEMLKAKTKLYASLEGEGAPLVTDFKDDNPFGRTICCGRLNPDTDLIVIICIHDSVFKG